MMINSLQAQLLIMLSLLCVFWSPPSVEGRSTFQRNLERHSKKIEDMFHLRTTEKAEQSSPNKKDDNAPKHKDRSDDDDDDNDDDDERKEKSESNGSKGEKGSSMSKSPTAKNSMETGHPTHAPSSKDDSKQEKPVVKKPKGCRRRLKKGTSEKGKREKYDGKDQADDNKAKKEHDDDDDEEYSTSKKEKYDDTYYGKEEKLDDRDDDDECDDPTDPPEPTRAPAPAVPASEEDIDIPLAPYFVLYDILQTRIPLLSDYDELTAFTSSYLDNYFRFIFDESVETEYVKSTTALAGSEFRLAQPVRIDYATNVTFTSTSLIPGTSELETMIIGAFEGANGEAYAAAVAAGLDPSNIFATTSLVSYSVSEAMPPRLRFSPVVSAMFSALVALMVLVYRHRSTMGSSDETKSLVNIDEDDHHGQMRNITAGWKAGIAPSLTSTNAYETVDTKVEKAYS